MLRRCAQHSHMPHQACGNREACRHMIATGLCGIRFPRLPVSHADTVCITMLQLQSPLRRWGLQRPPAITRIKCTMPAMVEPQLLGPMPPPSAKSVTPLTHLQLEAFLREKGIQVRVEWLPWNVFW